MDNEQLLNEIQKLLEGMERRTDAKFANIDLRFDLVNTRLDSIDRRLALHAGALAHIVEWTNKYESELIRMASELADVKERLGKLENPAA